MSLNIDRPASDATTGGAVRDFAAPIDRSSPRAAIAPPPSPTVAGPVMTTERALALLRKYWAWLLLALLVLTYAMKRRRAS